MQTSITTQLNQLRQNLNLTPDQIDVGDVLPILVPSSFFVNGNWVGPFLRLKAPEIGLTWSVLRPNQTMRYVDAEMQRTWDSRQLDWKALAMRNLSDRTNGHPGVREIRKATGETASIAFMFADGYGPSRLLFRGGLAQRFPQGYRVAIPEMSCGLAFAKDLEGPELATVLEVIDHCYRKGTRPFSPKVYNPDELLPLDGSL